MKKIFALLIVFSLLFALFALFACGGEEKTTPDDPAKAPAEDKTEPAEPSYLETLPISDFEGYNFRIIAHHTPTWINFPEEQETGEPVNDALLRRNKALEERFNITVQNIAFNDSGLVFNNVKKSVNADDYSYDMLIASMVGTVAPLAQSGMLRDLKRTISTLWPATA